jgi:lycopene cyclase domain-containing protein
VTYTQIAVAAVLFTVVVDLALLRTRLLLRRLFWVAYAIIVFFQLVTNGVLTGFRIVRYDGEAIIGTSRPVFLGQGRLFWAPIEDLLFGFALVTLTMVLWVWWGRRGVQPTPVAGPPRGPFRRRSSAGADRLHPRGSGDGETT